MELDAFSEWLREVCAVMSFTFMRGSKEDLFDKLGLDISEATPMSYLEAFDTSTHKIRVGELDHWAYAVEGSSVAGSFDHSLRALSVGGVAFNLSYTIDMDTFTYYSNGEKVCALELGTSSLYGPDKMHFREQMEAAGVLTRIEPTYITGPRFIRQTFGITLTLAMVEQKLLSVNIDPMAFQG